MDDDLERLRFLQLDFLGVGNAFPASSKKIKEYKNTSSTNKDQWAMNRTPRYTNPDGNDRGQICPLSRLFVTQKMI